jgi:hypothetical protein
MRKNSAQGKEFRVDSKGASVIKLYAICLFSEAAANEIPQRLLEFKKQGELRGQI